MIENCCQNASDSVRTAFANVPAPEDGVARKPLGEELSREVFRRIRRCPNESIPFYLSEILVEICHKPDRAMINDMIEFLDFNLSATISDSEHKEIWGEDGLEIYKQTNQRHLEDNDQVASLLSGEQAHAILCWLRWVKESTNFDWWRNDQLEGAIQYWAARSDANHGSDSVQKSP
jgi:hypothetical protein